ncbi:MAG: glycosyltransferase, partial [Pseudomonadales bacterium]
DDVSYPEYRQFEYLSEEYGDVLACADVVLSRAGANSIYELLALRKPHLLVPLSAAASRGDQLVNARIMAARGLSLSLTEAELSADTLRQALNVLLSDQQMRANMAALPQDDPLALIIQLIESHA